MTLCRAIRFVLSGWILVLALPAAADQAPPRLALVGVRVLTMSQPPVLEDRTVLVVGDRIEAIAGGAELAIPAGARVIAGGGRVLMPGLVDTHIHLREAQPPALLDYLRAGITTARELNGRPFLLAWRDRIERGELLGPRLRVAAPSLGNWSSPRDGYPMPTSAEEGRTAVRGFHAQGYDWVKVYSFLGREAFAAVVTEAQRLGMPVAGHVPIEVGLGETLGSGIRSIEHLTEYVGGSLTEEARKLDELDLRSVFGAGDVDRGQLDRFVRLTAEAGVWNVPTLIWFDRHLPAPQVQEAWDRPELRKQAERNRREIVRLLHEQGAPLAVGTDSDAGDDEPATVIYEELAALHEAGLASGDILHAATIGGATLLGLADEIGTVESGKIADLILLGCDPLERLSCIGRIELVVSRGRIVE